MSPEKIFYLLKDAELRAGELYALIALSISVAQPGLSDLFNELAEEEKLHARQIELLQGIFKEGADAFIENPEAEGLIREFLQNLEMIRDYFNRHYAQMRPSDLVGLALDLERHLVETHGFFFVKTTDTQARSLFQSLNLGDSAHVRKLEEYKPG
jgi:rubrerythrin